MFAGELKKQKVLFAAVDAAALACAFFAALAVHKPKVPLDFAESSPLPAALAASAVIALWILVLRVFKLYQIRTGGLTEAVAVIKACAAAMLLTIVSAYLLHAEPSRLSMMFGFLFSVPAILAARMATRMFIRHMYSNPNIAVPLVVVGFNPVGQHLFDQILEETTQYEVVGFLDDHVQHRQYRGQPVLGGFDRLPHIAALYPNLEAAIAIPDATRERQEEIIALCEQNRITWSLVPWHYRSSAIGLDVDMVGSVPLLRPRGSNIQGLNFALKRSFDFVAAAALLILASPAIILGALAVRLFDGRPIFLRQTRIGIHGRTFELLKLRTMRTGASDTVHREYTRLWINNGHSAAVNGKNGHGPVFKLVNDDRITKVGKILRRFSIDELPQLINVVRGDMSLIGPRPALPYELELYQAWHRRRLEAVPGITGLWQVNGRNRIGFDDMVRLDVQYLEEWSLAKDLRILVRTVPILLRGDGV
ncbi:MAG: sugar transferase [Candidatus Binataceae bacterium]|nr:sugar transferase [Candidatus Binataceae bacterium]